MCPEVYVDLSGDNLYLISGIDLKKVSKVADEIISGLKKNKRIISFQIMHVDNMMHGESADGSVSEPVTHDHDFACIMCFEEKQ